MFYQHCLFSPLHSGRFPISLLNDPAQVISAEHIHGKTEENIMPAVIIIIQQMTQYFPFLPLFRQIRFDPYPFRFGKIFLLISVRDQGIMQIDPVISFTRILPAFKAVLHITVPDTAGSDRAGRITGAV